MKKFIIVLLSIFLFTSTAYAKTMYLKDTSWSYGTHFATDNEYVSIYGENETVEVLHTYQSDIYEWNYDKQMYYVTPKIQKVCLVKKNGLEQYIPKSLLTDEKPEYTYTVKKCYKELSIDENAYIYELPTSKSNKIKLKENIVFYTTGQTNKWYQIYYKGHIYFIRKNSKYISNISDSEFPVIIDSNNSLDTIYRVKYYYSMLPEEIRKEILDLTIIISTEEVKKLGFKTAGYINYLSQEIYLCDDNKLEYALFHEIGHYLYRFNKPVNHDECISDINNLCLGKYFIENNNEYYAQGFDLYMRQYDTLKENAPNLFEYYDNILR